MMVHQRVFIVESLRKDNEIERSINGSHVLLDRCSAYLI